MLDDRTYETVDFLALSNVYICSLYLLDPALWIHSIGMLLENAFIAKKDI